MQNFSKACVSLLVALGLSSCNFLGLLNFQSLDFGQNGASGNGATSIEDNNPSETESNLFADGPVDIPVSIAKLDTPDASKISVEIGGVVGNSINAPSQFLSAQTFTINIAGDVGCVSTPSETPKVKIFNLDTGESSVGVVDAQGRFDTSIPARLGANVALAATVEDESSASPFLRIITDDVTGTHLIVTTNTNRLETSPIAVDDEGNYYLSIHYAEDATFTFFKRNIQGTEVRVYLEHTDEQLLKMDLITESQIAYLNQYGEVQLLTPTIPASLVRGLGKSQPAFDEVVSVKRTLHEYDVDIDMLQDIRVFMSFNEDGVLTSKPFIENEDAFSDYFRISATNSIPLIRTNRYDDASISVGDTYLYAFALPTDEASYSLYRANLDTTNLSLSWSNRETLVQNISDAPVLFSDASDVNSVVFSVDDAGTKRNYYWSQTTGVQALNDPTTDANVYAKPIIAPGGEFVLLCAVAQISGAASHISVWRPGVDAPGELQPLTGSAANSTCDDNGTYEIASNGFIHLYFRNADGTLPQHAIINANTHELLGSLLAD